MQPENFNLLGGEPTLHKDLAAFVRLARRHWPGSELRLVTNGFFLDRHPELPSALSETNAVLTISMHHESAEYQQRFRSIEGLARGWQRDHGIRLHIRHANGRWTRRYHGVHENMQPFEDNQPRQSWTICPARHCMQLHLGKIWKCAPLAYLGMQDERYGLGEKWGAYLRYRPLEPDCSDSELREFLGREEESFCAMCPATPQAFDLPNPMISLGVPGRRA